MSRHRFDLDVIKAGLVRYLEKTGLNPRPEKGGREFKALCPLHQDTDPSMTAKEKEPGRWVWYCHVCGEGGSLIDLHAKRAGMDAAGAIAELGDLLNAPRLDDPAPRSARPSVRALARGSRTTDADDDRIPGLPGGGSMPPPKPPVPEPLTGDAAAECSGAVSALIADEDARRDHAAALGVSPVTLARLAAGLDLGLIGGRLAYLAHDGADWHGCQVRNRPGENPRFFWKHGKPFLPWRGWRLKDRRVRTVYLCEGQSDAIALIDAGLEDLDDPAAPVAVVAVPGTSFPDHWPALFRFRRVILCGDRDEPGQKAVRKIGETLLPLAESVRVFSWAAVPKQAATAKDLRELYQTLKNSPSAKP
jgi:hypothetical protein